MLLFPHVVDEGVGMCMLLIGRVLLPAFFFQLVRIKGREEGIGIGRSVLYKCEVDA